MLEYNRLNKGCVCFRDHDDSSPPASPPSWPSAAGSGQPSLYDQQWDRATGDVAWDGWVTLLPFSDSKDEKTLFSLD